MATSKKRKPKAKAKAKREEQVLAGRSVLVVDDDPASAKLHAVVLAVAGADVTVAPSAEEALETLATMIPDVVLVDLILPGMDGIELARKVRAQDKTRHVIFIALTVVNGPDIERRVLEAGCAAYLRKPIDTDTIAATVAQVIKETK